MKNRIGETYNYLTIIEDLGKQKKSNHRMVRCLCSCGNEIITRYFDVYTSRTKSCGCFKQSDEYRRLARENSLKLVEEGKISKIDEDTEFKFYLKSIRSRDKTALLTINDIRNQWQKQHGRCAYTDIPLILATHSDYNFPRFMQASVDRINSDLGYEVGNIQFVSITCNYAKNAMSHDEMKAFVDIIKFGYENLI